MIKAGFQGLDISGVDLTAQSPTLPGGYATCQAADGKTVLVLTAAGAVQCSVKKVSTNYVLAGVTGDGKILSITIGSTDGISVSENAVPSGEESDYKFGIIVDITSYNSVDSPYAAPSDGIIRLYNSSRDNALTSAYSVEMEGISYGGVVTYFSVLSNPVGATNPSTVSCPIRKGQKVYLKKNTPDAEEAGTPKMSFFPYEEE